MAQFILSHRDAVLVTHHTPASVAIRIAPTVFHSESKLSGYEGVADAKLVRATIETAIAHREASVRNVYRQVLEDATERRQATEPSQA